MSYYRGPCRFPTIHRPHHQHIARPRATPPTRIHSGTVLPLRHPRVQGRKAEAEGDHYDSSSYSWVRQRSEEEIEREELRTFWDMTIPYSLDRDCHRYYCGRYWEVLRYQPKLAKGVCVRHRHSSPSGTIRLRAT